jgi:hypothetical protein
MFDIDIPTLIVASIFIAIFLPVFFYYSVKSKKARMEFCEKFNCFISKLNLNLSLKEDWRNRYILGLDKLSMMLVYCNFVDKEEKLAISLPEVSKFEVSEYFYESSNGTKSNKVLENLSLKIQIKNQSKTAILLPIYSAGEFPDLLGETVLASNWAKIINQKLTK